MRFASELPEGSPFAAREVIARKDARSLAREILAMSQEDLAAAFRRSPMKRAKLRGLKRNAVVVLGNTGTMEDVPVLQQALEDSEPLVRKHAASALARRRRSHGFVAERSDRFTGGAAKFGERTVKPSLQASTAIRVGRTIWELTDAQSQLPWLHQLMREQDTDEVPVLLAECHEFARSEVVRLDTPPGVLARVLVLESHRTSFPARGEGRGLDRHPVHVESVRAVEVGVEPKDSVDQVHLVDGVSRCHVCLGGLPQFLRRFWVLTQDGLRAKDDHLGFIREIARGTNGMFQLLASQVAPSPSKAVRAWSSTACRSSGERIPRNGNV